MLASVSVSGGEAAAQASTTPVPSFPCNFSSECSGFLELAGVQDAIFSCNFGRCVKARPVNDVWQLSESATTPHYTGFSTLVKHRSRVWSRLAPSYTTTFPGWQSAPTTGTVTAGVSSYIFTHIELSKNKSIHIWNYRKNADLCFCHHGRCSNIKWECHTASECKAHQKCKDKKCVCVGKFEVYILKTMWYLHNGREHLRVRVWHKRGLWRPEPPVSPTEGIPVRVSYETFFTTKSNHLPSLPGIHG